MKPYGVKLIEHPDVADIQEMGCKSSVGGRNYNRNVATKARTRRRWARKARAEGTLELERIGDEIALADFLARKPWFDDHHLNASDCYVED